LTAGDEGDLADAVELLDGPLGRQALVVKIRVAQVGGGQPVADELLDDRGEHTHGDVPPDPVLGPMEDRPQPSEDLSTGNRRSTCWRDRQAASTCSASATLVVSEVAST
jgi:hypothetical protein